VSEMNDYMPAQCSIC